MGLKKYYIDGSDVPDNEVPSVMYFIEHESFNHALDLERKCSYVAFWEERFNLSNFPELKSCKIRELP